MAGLRTTYTLAVAVALLPGIASAQWPLGRDEGIAGKGPERAETIMVSGRYQVFVSPHAKGHTFMIDTDTGRVWVLKKDSASGEFSFHRVPVDQVDADKKGKPAAKE
ncbi:MAG: hypothetical protein ACP5M0_11645 [Desulfomonilaceae bacterium]